MKKKEALAVLDACLLSLGEESLNLNTEEDVEKKIRILSDENKGLEITVFELGCSILAKTYIKDIREFMGCLGDYEQTHTEG